MQSVKVWQCLTALQPQGASRGWRYALFGDYDWAMTANQYGDARPGALAMVNGLAALTAASALRLEGGA